MSNIYSSDTEGYRKEVEKMEAERERKRKENLKAYHRTYRGRCPHCGKEYGTSFGTGDCACDPDPE